MSFKALDVVSTVSQGAYAYMALNPGGCPGGSEFLIISAGLVVPVISAGAGIICSAKAAFASAGRPVANDTAETTALRREFTAAAHAVALKQAARAVYMLASSGFAVSLFLGADHKMALAGVGTAVLGTALSWSSTKNALKMNECKIQLA